MRAISSDDFATGDVSAPPPGTLLLQKNSVWWSGPGDLLLKRQIAQRRVLFGDTGSNVRSVGPVKGLVKASDWSSQGTPSNFQEGPGNGGLGGSNEGFRVWGVRFVRDIS